MPFPFRKGPLAKSRRSLPAPFPYSGGARSLAAEICCPTCWSIEGPFPLPECHSENLARYIEISGYDERYAGLLAFRSGTVACRVDRSLKIFEERRIVVAEQTRRAAQSALA